MAKLINTTRRDIILLTRHVIPALGSLITTEEVIRCTDNWPRLNGLIIAGDIVVEYDDPPAAITFVESEAVTAVADPSATDAPVTEAEVAAPKAARQKT